MTPMTVKEVLNGYAHGHRDFRDIELDSDIENFRSVNLSGCDFSNSCIATDFSGDVLENVNFSYANLKTSIFDAANLKNADFSNAALCATSFENVVLTGCDFDGAYYHSYTLTSGEFPNW